MNKNRIHSNRRGIVVGDQGKGIITNNALRGNDKAGLVIEIGAGDVFDTGNLK